MRASARCTAGAWAGIPFSHILLVSRGLRRIDTTHRVRARPARGLLWATLGVGEGACPPSVRQARRKSDASPFRQWSRPGLAGRGAVGSRGMGWRGVALDVRHRLQRCDGQPRRIGWRGGAGALGERLAVRRRGVGPRRLQPSDGRQLGPGRQLHGGGVGEAEQRCDRLARLLRQAAGQWRTRAVAGPAEHRRPDPLRQLLRRHRRVGARRGLFHCQRAVDPRGGRVG